MHEMAICMALLRQASDLARDHQATRVTSLTVLVGALSGVEPALLENAFSVARAGTLAHDARLICRFSGARVRCSTCGAESEVPPNKLLCPACGEWRTTLVSGTELVFQSLEMDKLATVHNALVLECEPR